jgi:hypothetical protein
MMFVAVPFFTMLMHSSNVCTEGSHTVRRPRLSGLSTEYGARAGAGVWASRSQTSGSGRKLHRWMHNNNNSTRTHRLRRGSTVKGFGAARHALLQFRGKPLRHYMTLTPDRHITAVAVRVLWLFGMTVILNWLCLMHYLLVCTR